MQLRYPPVLARSRRRETRARRPLRLLGEREPLTAIAPAHLRIQPRHTHVHPAALITHTQPHPLQIINVLRPLMAPRGALGSGIPRPPTRLAPDTHSLIAHTYYYCTLSPTQLSPESLTSPLSIAPVALRQAEPPAFMCRGRLAGQVLQRVFSRAPAPPTAVTGCTDPLSWPHDIQPPTWNAVLDMSTSRPPPPPCRACSQFTMWHGQRGP